VEAKHSLINNMSHEIYLELKTAVELGHWSSGKILSEAQKVLSIQALISYENKHLQEKDRTAYIHKIEHDACDSSVDNHHDHESHDQERPVKFKI